MMATVFSNPTYQHMVNTNKTKFYTMQADLINQPDYAPLRTSVRMSGIMHRISPEVSTQLLGAKSPTHTKNWSIILDEFLPRNERSSNRTLKRRRNCQYKPVVLRNKTPFAQLNPQLLPPQQYHNDEETNTLRLSKAYTLPHNKATDVPEILPSGDSSINGSEDEQQYMPSPLSRIMLNLLNRIYQQTSLNGYMGSLQNFCTELLNCRSIQFLTSSYCCLYDFLLNIALSLRHTILPNTLTRLKQVIIVEPVALIWKCALNTYFYMFHYCSNRQKPLLYEVIVNPTPSESDETGQTELNQHNQPIEEFLSKSAIVSFGRYCNFESFKSDKVKR